MEIAILQTFSFCEKGRRGNNEDYIFEHLKHDEQQGLFIVCDGVGGVEKGEIASQLACKSFEQFFLENQTKEIDKKHLTDAFDRVQNNFDTYITANLDAKGMATTAVLAVLHSQGVAVLHCGDSRLYHFRNEKVLWKTEDHTVINELLRKGIITEEEANDSNKNKLSRAIQGSAMSRVRPDISFLTDLQAGDYILLCSDGVWGCFADEELATILYAPQSKTEKCDIIKSLCQANSQDNFSMILLKIEEKLPQKLPNETHWIDKIKTFTQKIFQA